MAAGTALAAGLTLAGMGKVWGWHAGVLGLALNVIVGVAVSWIGRGPDGRGDTDDPDDHGPGGVRAARFRVTAGTSIRLNE